MQIPTEEFQKSLKPYMLEYLQNNSRFKVLRFHRGARKTTLFLNDILIEVHKKKGLYWYVGPYLEEAVSTIWTDPNTSIFRWIPEEYQKTLHINHSNHSIEFPNGSLFQLKGANHPDSLRGPKPLHIWVDEYGEVAKRWGSMFRETILEPSIRSSGGGMSFAGTPTGNNDFKFIFDLAKNNKDWWASQKTVDDTGIYTKEDITEIRNNSSNEKLFLQEYYCEIVEGANSVFKNIEGCIQGELERPQDREEYIFGIDLARTQDNTVIVGFRKSDNHLVFFESLNNVMWETQKQIIERVLTQYNNAVAVIDATGSGDNTYEQLATMGLKVTGYKFAGNLPKRAIIERLANYISEKIITYPNIPELLDELRSYEQVASTRSGAILFNAPIGKHDDIVIALALASTMLYPIVKLSPEQEYQNYRNEVAIDIDPKTGYFR